MWLQISAVLTKSKFCFVSWLRKIKFCASYAFIFNYTKFVVPEPLFILHFSVIRHAKAEFDSPYGRIANAWEIKGNTFVDKVCVPPNTTARLSLPASSAAAVSEGGKPLVRNKYVRLVGEEEGRTIVEVGSGTYEFSVEN